MNWGGDVKWVYDHRLTGEMRVRTDLETDGYTAKIRDGPGEMYMVRFRFKKTRWAALTGVIHRGKIPTEVECDQILDGIAARIIEAENA